MQTSTKAAPYGEASDSVRSRLDGEIELLFEGTTDWRCLRCEQQTPTTGLFVTDEGLPVCPTDDCIGLGWSDLVPVGHVYRTTA